MNVFFSVPHMGVACVGVVHVDNSERFNDKKASGVFSLRFMLKKGACQRAAIVRRMAFTRS